MDEGNYFEGKLRPSVSSGYWYNIGYENMFPS